MAKPPKISDEEIIAELERYPTCSTAELAKKLCFFSEHYLYTRLSSLAIEGRVQFGRPSHEFRWFVTPDAHDTRRGVRP